jgi:ATP-binding cassette subfamily B protein
MGQFAELYSQLQKAVGSTQRVRELLRETGEVEVSLTPASSAPLPRLRGEVRLEQVRFTYPSRPEVEVLHGIDVSAAPGQKIALVGPVGRANPRSSRSSYGCTIPHRDGCSSTVARHGTIRWPTCVRRWRWCRRRCFFGGSIAENIAYGKPGATAGEIEAAAHQANAHDFIRAFPEGYGTLVGDRGIRLSGGSGSVWPLPGPSCAIRRS